MAITDILSIVSAPFTETVKWAFRPLKRWICYVIKYKENIESLQHQAQDLEIQRNDLQNRVDGAKRKFEEPTQSVAAWLMKAGNIQIDVSNLNQQALDEKRCVKGLCPDVGMRHQLSKQALEIAKGIKKLQDDIANFGRISCPPPARSIEPVQRCWVEGLESRSKILELVLDALCDESIRSAAVFGMGGSGKTTLMKSLINELEKTHLFKKVIMLTVSRSPNINNLQDTIADRLGLGANFKSLTCEQTKSNKLLEALKKEEPVLIILDDIWKPINLTDTGIPCGDEHLGCKLIVTTRDLQVCGQMGIKKTLEMKLLSEEEAWTLFEKKAGNVVTRPDLRPIAEEIARRCQGSPLAINVLGSSLNGTVETQGWRHVLNVLRNPQERCSEGVMEEVFASLKHSYDLLPGTEIKLCFLFCCQYPEDFNICLRELRDYGVGDGFLNVNGSLEDASDQRDYYVKILKDRSLLLDGDSKGYVKLHDVVRDVGLWIAKEKENWFLVNVGTISRECSEVEMLKECRRVSFMEMKEKVDIGLLSQCPKLRTLLIKDCKEVTFDQHIPSETTQALRVLHMDLKTFTQFNHPVVPSLAIASLTNLRSLCLISCELSASISALGRMCNLEILSLKLSTIGILPEEIGNLTNLKCLDLTRARISDVAANVFSRLSKLEELYAIGEFDNWNKEVASLVHLSCLKIRLRDCRFEGVSFSWNNLKDMDVRINDTLYSDVFWGHYSNSLSIERAQINYPFIPLLSKIRQRLRLESIDGLSNVLDLVEAGDGFKQLETLEMEFCDEMENMMSIDEESKSGVEDSFQCLKILVISNMKNMKRIFEGSAPERFLPQLQEIECRHCDKLKNVLSANTLLPAQSLEKLEKLKVIDCSELEEVFSREWELGEAPQAGTSTNANFPPRVLSGLTRIELTFLPKLRSIWKGSVAPVGSLEEVTVYDCPALTYMFTSSEAERLENLKELDIKNCDGMERLVLEWKSNKEERWREESGLMSGDEKQPCRPPCMLLPIFLNLQKLILLQCDNLKQVFPLSVVSHRGDLPQLKTLNISFCINLEEIFGGEEEEEATEAEEDGHHGGDFLLPKLESLSLSGLPNLTCIYRHGTLPLISSRDLKKVQVFECPKLKRLPLDPRCVASNDGFKIEGEKEWFDELVWDDQTLKSIFNPYFTSYQQEWFDELVWDYEYWKGF